MMTVPVPNPRHMVEKSDDFVRVTLPAKKNAFRILFMCLWLGMWIYMVSGIVYIALTIHQAIEIGKNATPPIQPDSMFVYVALCLAFLFLALVALGAFGIYRMLWLLLGKEVIEATPQRLILTQQVARWNRSKEYPTDKISDLRPNTQPVSTLFFPGKRVKKFLGGMGMIAFEYGARTFSFAQDVEEAEAKQIILVLKDALPQPNAG